MVPSSHSLAEKPRPAPCGLGCAVKLMTNPTMRSDKSSQTFGGAHAYNTVRPLAYKDANVFFLCFLISDPDTLDNTVYRWHPEVRDHSSNVPVILCGCQSDLRTDSDTLTSLAKVKKVPVSSEQALAASRRIGATTYVETSSSVSGCSVRDAFEVAALAALGKLNKNHVTVPRQTTLVKSKYKSKIDLKDDFRDRGKNCVVM
ncbi:rho-related GTP-binding protein RhoE-like [Limulus polyphemus]|uniref:Rho-related GTP-binding protein RhoE-like n=1 Tax=Limulus polyphemus TaxID=6850 RepID=A0ABM1BTG6_LIMPO|nr:rho-related GTP-binding protein RhoE-like [Limulus polyphemus]